MRSSVKRFVAAALAGVAALTFGPTARAQFAPPAGNNNPLFRVNPALMGAAQGAAAAARVAPGLGGVGNPYVGGAGFVDPFRNPFAATISSTPYSSPGYGGGGSQSPYSNPYVSYYDPFGGYFRGVGDLVSSYGKYGIDNNTARLINQQVEQEKIRTRRMLFEEWRYERMNMPTAEDVRKRDRDMALARARSEPPLPDIVAATSLNSLLAHLKDAHAKGQRGTRFDLDEEQLKKVNVSSAYGGNIGLFKNKGKFNWPLALRGENFDAVRQQFEDHVGDAVNRAGINGRVDVALMKDLLAEAKAMHAELEKPKSVGELSPAQYMEAKRFLNLIDDGVKALQDPNVANYFNRKYEARGKTVGDLIDHMAKEGLTFAAAVPGEEAAYRSLQNSLAAYDEATGRTARRE